MSCWENYPLSTSPLDPPGTRLVNGQRFVPVAGKPCVMRDESGAEWETIETNAIKPETSPDSTQLSDFPQFPVLFLQEPSIPGAGNVMHTIWKKANDITGNGYDVVLYAHVANKWLSIAEQYYRNASNPLLASAWLKRLRKEMSDPVINTGCVLACGKELRKLYLIANAAAYLAGMWAKQSLVPPVVPSSQVLQNIADKLAGKIEEFASSKLGLYVFGGLAAAGIIYAMARK